MAELQPYPFDALIRRMFRELSQRQAVFDLPARKFFGGMPGHDLSVRFHGRPASSPLGPAAGPQSQLAQNIVLCWLGGCRIVELKTVQVLDELEIPRPCIDMQTIGFNVEWSQELKLQQSLEEYVKASMLIEMLVASGEVALEPGFGDVIYDMSVGYDLAGIQSAPVLHFIRSMLDAGEVVERLRGQIPDEYRRFRELDYSTRLSDTLTLSTFHGCPPDEIERIIEFLLRDVGLNCVIKLNPTLLGPDAARGLLNEQLGYRELVIPDSAFENDTRWEQAVGFVERLGTLADELGLGLGVKFSNTLIVENHRDFFPAAEQQMYLSGVPLHVLAINLVGRFRAAFGDRFPISFSAGIDRANVADAAACGLTPITVCSDLLKPGGYGRAQGYAQALIARMDAVGAATIGDFIIRAYGHGQAALDDAAPDATERERCEDALAQGGALGEAAGEALYARWRSAAIVRNTADYVARATADPRYAKARNSKPPKKIGSRLELFDCITCDKCIPVCPNDANFTFVLPELDVPVVLVTRDGDGWTRREAGRLAIAQKHQIGNFADFCNECGNCDIFCPEDGGPYLIKPRFFGTLESWREFSEHDGFHIGRDGERVCVHGRFGGAEFVAELNGDRARYRGDGFELALSTADPEGTLSGEAKGEVDLTYLRIMDWLQRALLAPDAINYVSCLDTTAT